MNTKKSIVVKSEIIAVDAVINLIHEYAKDNQPIYLSPRSVKMLSEYILSSQKVLDSFQDANMRLSIDLMNVGTVNNGR